jgi:Tfp pilus assembly protein PilF
VWKTLRWLALAILLAILIFALPTWWMRVWLPRQGGLPTPIATATVSPLDAVYAEAVATAAGDPLAALPLLAQVAFSESPKASAALTIRQAIQAGRAAGDEAYLLTSTGQGLAAAGEWDAAREAFLNAVDANPDYAEAWAYLGEAMQQTGQDGLPSLLRAQRLDANSLSVRLFLALYWQRQGEYARADLNLRVAAKLYPQNPLIQIQLGENAVLAGDSPGALAYFERALELAPDDPSVWRSLAAYSVETGLYVEEIGLPAARLLLADYGDQAAVLTLNARAAALAGDGAAAETLFKRALQAEPDSPESHLYYGVFLLADARVEEASQHLNQVLLLAPASPEAELAAYWLEQTSH